MALSPSYVPTAGNLADMPSRTLPSNDCRLAPQAWNKVEVKWGLHTLDRMAVDYNVQRGKDGQPLPHYTSWPTENSSGLNVFAQRISRKHVYVFSPFVLIGPLLRFLTQSSTGTTTIVPDIHLRRFWWPILSKRARDSLCIGAR